MTVYSENLSTGLLARITQIKKRAVLKTNQTKTQQTAPVATIHCHQSSISNLLPRFIPATACRIWNIYLSVCDKYYDKCKGSFSLLANFLT
jgi:hypothetical protein